MESRLNNLSTYFIEKERKKLDKIAQQNPSGLPEMSFEEIKLSCLQNNGYETPELNDKIYLHFRGFKKIENLDKFYGCKALWLDSNGFSKIENLAPLVDLRCLYLSKNLIGRIEGLEALQHLTILDLSNNRLASIENLSCCPNLQTLNVSHNFLTTVDSISHLKECPALNNIDITNNRLETDEGFFGLFSAVPALVALSINGNEVTKLGTFRKRMISGIPKLGYLDRPIDVQERTFAEAFVAGGAEAESAAREQWKRDVEKKRVDELATFKAWQEEQKLIREEARAEGRSLITEFTPEEQAQRQAEAEAAHTAEQRMLDIGISKVAARYYQLEGRNTINSSGLSAGGVDALELAALQLAEEEDAAAAARRTAAAAAPAEVVSEEPADESEEVPSPSRVMTEVEESDAEEEEESTAALPEPTEVPAGSEATNAATSSAGVEESKSDLPSVSDEAAADAARILEVSEAEMQRIREERVAESFYIYKKQLEERKSGKASLPPPSRPSTWDTPAPVVPEEDRPLYWSEAMDMHLAKLVKTCVFDFDAICLTMQQLASKNALSNSAVHKKPALLSNEACRLRWAQLDAQQWSTVAPNSTALDTQFKVCISSAVLGAGHGSQPSYEALASMAAGSVPTYLKVPTAFPSVQDQGEDSDLDLD